MLDLAIGTYNMDYKDVIIRCVKKPDGAVYAKVTDLHNWIVELQDTNRKDPESAEALLEHMRKQMFSLLD
jgi:hypothetical protein